MTVVESEIGYTGVTKVMERDAAGVAYRDDVRVAVKVIMADKVVDGGKLQITNGVGSQ